MSLREETKNCLRFIIPIISRYDPNYIISGGLASIIYGSSRELADIDISVSEDVFKEVIEEFKDYITEDHSTKNYVDESWDMPIVTFNIQGQEVDIFTHSRNKIYSMIEKKWIPLHFRKFNRAVFEGISLNVVPLDELIQYKRHTMREVDLIDVENLTKK